MVLKVCVIFKRGKQPPCDYICVFVHVSLSEKARVVLALKNGLKQLSFTPLFYGVTSI